MSFVAEQAHVTLSGDIAGEYLVEDRRPDGRLVLVPEVDDGRPAVKWTDMRDPAARDLSAEEWKAFLAEHGPHMLPPDGEG